MNTSFNAAIAALKSELQSVQEWQATERLRSTNTKLLLVYSDPIYLLRIIIADKMGFTCWDHLASRLRVERWRSSRPTHAKLEHQLTASGLGIVIWNHLWDIADAEFHVSNDMQLSEILQMVRSSCIPRDLLYTKSSLDQAIVWLMNEVQQPDFSCSS